jgi:thiamine transporter ThiT
MSLMPMVLLSLLMGIVAAGFSWYIWGIVENILHRMRSDPPEE